MNSPVEPSRHAESPDLLYPSPCCYVNFVERFVIARASSVVPVLFVYLFESPVCLCFRCHNILFGGVGEYIFAILAVFILPIVNIFYYMPIFRREMPYIRAFVNPYNYSRFARHAPSIYHIYIIF